MATTVRRLRTTWPGLTVTTRVCRGEPADELIAASRAAALVVVGGPTQPTNNARRALFAWAAAYAQCPTLVVPSTAPMPDGGPVVIALNLAPRDEPVTEFAFDEAAARGVPLVAVYVWSISDIAPGAIGMFAYDLERLRGVADRALVETLAGWPDKYPTVRVNRMPLYGADAARTLVDASRRAGLIVVGARCRRS
jgi:hypothetical protein